MSTFDIVILVILFIGGIYGWFAGFIKQIFGFIGLILGFFLASKFALPVGEYVNSYIFHLKSASSGVYLMGFLVLFFGVWLAFSFLGFLISTILSKTGNKLINSILGFFLGAFKMFLIFSIIIALSMQIKLVKKNLKKVCDNSLFCSIMVKFGNEVMHLDFDEKMLKFEKRI
jgi:membrane protein required for colicin V production